MAYIKSEKVKVFPTTKRSAANEDGFNSRNWTEKTVTNVVNLATDIESYVITENFTGNANDYIEFVIHGYYFKINQDQLKIGSNVYGCIELIKNEGFEELKGQDSEEGSEKVYTGLVLNATPSGDYSLKILNYDGTNYSIPAESMVKFKSKSFAAFDIDGGII